MTHTYTFEDIQYLFHEPLTPNQQASLVNYVNTGEVPPADPCQSCEPNVIRRYIGRIQKAQRDGTFPKANRLKLEHEFVPAVVSVEDPTPKVTEGRSRPAKKAK